MRHSSEGISVLLRSEHHDDHTFLDATHYRDDDGVLVVLVGEQEIARFAAGSWDGAYRDESTRVREKDGRERPAQRLELRLTHRAVLRTCRHLASFQVVGELRLCAA